MTGLVLGLSDENVGRLLQGQPIYLDGRQLDTPEFEGIDIVLHHAATEEALLAMVERYTEEPLPEPTRKDGAP